VKGNCSHSVPNGKDLFPKTGLVCAPLGCGSKTLIRWGFLKDELLQLGVRETRRLRFMLVREELQRSQIVRKFV
jgi:hypothetical protein